MFQWVNVEMLCGFGVAEMIAAQGQVAGTIEIPIGDVGIGTQDKKSQARCNVSFMCHRFMSDYIGEDNLYNVHATFQEQQ